MNPINKKKVNPANAVVPPAQASGLQVTPFQTFLGEATEALERISQTEFKTNDLIGKYVAGEANIQDVMLSLNELTLGVSVATTVVNTGVQTFKEIQQMPV